MSSTSIEVHPSEMSPARRLIGTVLRSREMAVAAVLVALVVVTAIKSPGFVTGSDGWRSLLVNPSILIVLAVGQTLVIITRNVDLSVGSIMGLTAYLTGRLFIDTGLPAPVVVLLAILAGAGLGLINGALVAFGKVPALVITLGTLYIYRGVFLSWAGSDRITASDIPAGFLDLGTEQVLTIPVLTLVALVVLAAVGYHLHTARSGRELYAIGSDPGAAVLYGLRTTRRVLGAFVVSGALAGLAGVFYVARYGTVSSGAGLNMELQAVGAAVIGGVAIFGGSGTVWGAAIGATLLVTINSALPVLGISDFWQRAVVGALILAAVVLDRVLSLRQEKRLVAARDLDTGPEPPPVPAASGATSGATGDTPDPARTDDQGGTR
jgi:rhamnose transport system permease protein